MFEDYIGDMTPTEYDKHFSLGGSVRVTKGPVRFLMDDREILGLPQGLNTSPVLAIYSIYDWVERLKLKGINALMYADDGILYSNKKFDIPKPPEGHEFHESKSR